AVARLQQFGLILRVRQLPPAAGDSVERWVGVSRCESLLQERLPVVFQNAVQGIDNVLEGVRPHFGRTVLPAVEGAAKVIEALRSAALLANQCVGVEPD